MPRNTGGRQRRAPEAVPSPCCPPSGKGRKKRLSAGENVSEEVEGKEGPVPGSETPWCTGSGLRINPQGMTGQWMFLRIDIILIILLQNEGKDSYVTVV